MFAFLMLVINLVDITYGLPVRIQYDDVGYFNKENIHSEKISIRKRSIEDQELRRDVKVCTRSRENRKKAF